MPGNKRADAPGAVRLVAGQLRQLRREIGNRVLEHRQVQLVLVGEMVKDVGLADLRGAGQIGHRDAIETARGKQAHALVEDAVDGAAVGLAAHA